MCLASLPHTRAHVRLSTTYMRFVGLPATVRATALPVNFRKANAIDHHQQPLRTCKNTVALWSAACDTPLHTIFDYHYGNSAESGPFTSFEYELSRRVSSASK